MRTAKKAGKGYTLTYRKKTVSDDPYLPRGASKKISFCERCHAVYMNKRWYADEERYRSVLNQPDTQSRMCPGCRKIRDKFPGGIVTLRGEYVLLRKSDLMNLVRNEEAKARGFNPLERIMSIEDNGGGTIVISTTNEKMAQRLGRAINKAFHGDVTYRWSHDNKLIRVDWTREEKKR